MRKRGESVREVSRERGNRFFLNGGSDRRVRQERGCSTATGVHTHTHTQSPLSPSPSPINTYSVVSPSLSFTAAARANQLEPYSLALYLLCSALTQLSTNTAPQHTNTNQSHKPTHNSLHFRHTAITPSNDNL